MAPSIKLLLQMSHLKRYFCVASRQFLYFIIFQKKKLFALDCFVSCMCELFGDCSVLSVQHCCWSRRWFWLGR